MSFDRELSVAMDVAELAGLDIEKAFHNFQRSRFTLDRKQSGDSSSENDRIVENILRQVLTGEFPDYTFYGEEFGKTEGKSKYMWCWDPIDGTTQYALRIPHASISGALIDTVTRETLVGVVYNPITHDMYYARQHGGAHYKNKITGESHNIHITDDTDFKNMIVVFNPNNTENGMIDENGRMYAALRRHFRIVPVLYSTALDMTRVAEGLAGAVVSRMSHPYDHAAGALIVQEAGGIVQGSYDEKFNPLKCGAVAANNKETMQELRRAGVFEYMKRPS